MTSRKHDAVFDDILSDIDADAPAPEHRGGARFLKRSTALAERAEGAREEKTLIWVDPAECRMWEQHNRDYALLTEENCRDLIDGIRAQGRQEFPAIVRRTGEAATPYEVICGARRHFAVSWLRANNYPAFRYLIEIRDLTDEEAFRLSDIENRDRQDISDYERAQDYLGALGRYYDGRQKAMAERLEVSETWLSRYLQLARLPQDIVAAFPSIRDIRELHARTLKPLLAKESDRAALIAAARDLAIAQAQAREGQGAAIDAATVVARLKKSVSPARKPAAKSPRIYRGPGGEAGIAMIRKGNRTILEVPDTMTRSDVSAALDAFLTDRFGKG